MVYLLFTPTQDTDVVTGALIAAVDFRGLGVKSLGCWVHDGFNDINKIAFNFSIPVTLDCYTFNSHHPNRKVSLYPSV